MLADRRGFTLLEMLIGMAILGILMLAFTQIFGSSLRASSEINSRNELINEGQVAQQLITSRIQSAFFVYSGTIKLTSSGVTTRNTVRSGAGQNWIVGTDPFVAILTPPKSTGVCSATNPDACFTFYAYYPMLRSSLIAAAQDSAPPADPNNANVWVLMEYRANINDGVDRSSDQLKDPPLPGTTSGTSYMGRTGRLLVDYVQPTTSAPTYVMFNICQPTVSTTNPPCPVGTTTNTSVQVGFNLRLLQNRSGKALNVPSGTTTLSTQIYPRNIN